jgi:hypothetical protein
MHYILCSIEEKEYEYLVNKLSIYYFINKNIFI